MIRELISKKSWFPAECSQQLVRQMHAVRRLLPTPADRILHPDLAAQEKLARKISLQPDDHALKILAANLHSQEIAMLFPLLAQPCTTALLAAQITLIIGERACPSLYLSGWITLQHVYPNPVLEKALAKTCRLLEARQKHHPDHTGPEGVFSPAYRGFNLVSRLYPPGRRFFIIRLTEKIIKAGLPLGRFIREYQLHMDSALGMKIFRQYFLSGPPVIFINDLETFAQGLPKCGLSNQAELVAHFLGIEDLDQAGRNPVCQLIYTHFGDPDAESPDKHPIWDLLKPIEIKAFRDWIVAAKIGSHCRDNPEKARFYLAFTGHLVKLQRWDDETLLLHFPGFVLADTRRQPGLAMYYNQPRPGSLPFAQATGINAQSNPASSAIPHRQVDDAVRTQNFQGVVGLPFDEYGIRLSRVFLNLRLKETT